MGGVPAETVIVPGSSPTTTPFIGCIRDALIDTEVIDFNSIIYHTGVELDTCVVDEVSATGDTSKDTSIQEASETDKDKDDEDSKINEIEEESVWDIAPPETPSTVYGQCRLPVVPSPDPEVSARSGLRFGNKRETYLEFNKRLRLKKRSDFGIEFKTSASEGIIFYIADEKNSDFIALFVKEGKLIYGFNCGSGPVYIQSSIMVNDGRWHFTEFSRQAQNGKLYIDGNLMNENSAFGPATNIEVVDTFYLGGLPQDVLDMPIVVRNLKVKSFSYSIHRQDLQQWFKSGKVSKKVPRIGTFIF